MSNDDSATLTKAPRVSSRRWSARRVPTWALLAAGAVIGALLLPLALALTSRATAEQDRADAADTRSTQVQSAVAPLVDDVQRLCARNDAAATAVRARGLCGRADAAASVVTAAPVTVAAPGPSAADIDAAVARYLVANPPAPGRSVTPAMVATAVAQYLTANPPEPGRAPTPDEIAAAASTYIAAHADEFRGEAGADATDQQVQAAVAAYCDTHNGCAGPAGVDGVSQVDGYFARDDSGGCTYVVVFSDGERKAHPAGDLACPAGPGTTTTTTPPPSGDGLPIPTG